MRPSQHVSGSPVREDGNGERQAMVAWGAPAQSWYSSFVAALTSPNLIARRQHTSSVLHLAAELNIVHGAVPT